MGQGKEENVSGIPEDTVGQIVLTRGKALRKPSVKPQTQDEAEKLLFTLGTQSSR